jgi:hypothetical protein
MMKTRKQWWLLAFYQFGEFARNHMGDDWDD